MRFSLQAGEGRDSVGSAEVGTAPVPAMALPVVPYRAVTRGTPGDRITRATIRSRTSTEIVSGILVFFVYDEI